MFGFFKDVNIRTSLFMETTQSVQQFTNIDLARMPAKEQGAFGDRGIDILKKYDRKNKYTSVELNLVGWYVLVDQTDDTTHSLYAKRFVFPKGFADYTMSKKVSFSPDHKNPTYFPPYFRSFARDILNRIEDGRSLQGSDVKQFRINL
jgi:hypothetical protein